MNNWCKDTLFIQYSQEIKEKNSKSNKNRRHNTYWGCAADRISVFSN